MVPALRILRVSEPSQSSKTEHKSATGNGGHRIDASRNFWDSNVLKSVSTGVTWGSACTSPFMFLVAFLI